MGFSSSRVQAQWEHHVGLGCGILVATPGIKPMTPALEGGFLITGPPGKSLAQFYFRPSLLLCVSPVTDRNSLPLSAFLCVFHL